MQFGTLSSILNLASEIRLRMNSLEGIRFPMCIIHDSDCDIAVSREQINKILKHNRHSHKELNHITDGRHDLLANKPEEVCNVIMNFISN
jgi:esterase/lipase